MMTFIKFHSRWVTILGTLALHFCLFGNLPASGNSAASNLEGTKKVLADIFNLPVIRVGIASSVNNGHQSSAAQVIETLRKWGYTNEIEIIFTESNQRKMGLLFPKFDSGKTQPQSYPHLKIKFVPMKYFKSHRHDEFPELPFGIMGAGDFDHAPTDFGTRLLLIVQPYKWVRPVALWIKRNDGTLYSEVFKELNGLGHQFEKPSGDIISLIDSTMSQSDFLRAKSENLKEVLKKRALSLVPVYGHGVGGSTGNKKEVLYAAAVAASILNKKLKTNSPVVLLVLNEVPQNNQVSARTLIASDPEFAKIADISHILDPDLKIKIENMQPGKLLILYTGHVSKSVFEYLYSASALPPVVEGMNNLNLVEALGRPYLPTRRDEGYQFDSPPPIATSAFEAFLKPIPEKFSNSFGLHSEQVQAIGDYLSLVSHGDSKALLAFGANASRFSALIQNRLHQALLKSIPYYPLPGAGHFRK